MGTFRNITVVGLGLIGSSLAACVRRQWPEVRVRGVSSKKALTKALELDLIHEGYDYADTAPYADSDLVMLCTPISQILETLKRWREQNVDWNACLVVDVGSTKKEICREAEKTFKDHPGVRFVGSHPMAGSERSGLEARDVHLFENAAWILCPEDQKPVEPLESFLSSLGARVSYMQPEVHDAVVAHYSHLPQLLATALAAFTAQSRDLMERGLQVSGSGFYDMTRLANSPLHMWEPIVQTNRDKILESLDAFEAYLRRMREDVASQTLSALGAYFQSGQFLREKLIRKNRGFAAPFFDVFVTLPDKPKTLLAVISVLANVDLNIVDLEILKVREGEGGTAKLSFRKSEEAELALSQLVKAGFAAQKKG